MQAARDIGSPSPGACRAAISAWLWDQEVFVPSENATVLAPAAARRPRIRWLRSLATAAAAACAVALITGTVALERDGWPAWFPDLPGPPWAHAGNAARAWVTFDVTPWASVQIDDRPPF